LPGHVLSIEGLGLTWWTGQEVVDIILADEAETVPNIQGSDWIPLEVFEPCFQVAVVGKLQRLCQNSCTQALASVVLQYVELAKLHMSWLNIDRDRSDGLLVEDDDLPRFFPPVPLVMLSLERFIPTPARSDVRADCVSLRLKRELKVFGGRWAEQKFHEA